MEARKYNVGEVIDFYFVGPDMSSQTGGRVIYASDEHVIVRVACYTYLLKDDFSREGLPYEEVERITGHNIDSLKVHDFDVFVDLMNPFTYMAADQFCLIDQGGVFDFDENGDLKNETLGFFEDNVFWDTYVPDKFINGFKIVEKDGKFNYVSEDTNKLIDEQWYDRATNWAVFKGSLYSIVFVDGLTYRLESCDGELLIGDPIYRGFALPLETFITGSDSYDFTYEHNLGSSHCGDVIVEVNGSVILSGRQVDALVSLMREKGTSDVEELELAERLPLVYRDLDSAFRYYVVMAEKDHWLVQGYYDGAYEYDVYELMEYCEKECGFEFSGEEDMDEDELDEQKLEAFDEWLPDYLDTLSVEDRSFFIITRMNGEVEIDDVEYEIVIPQEIVKMV